MDIGDLKVRDLEQLRALLGGKSATRTRKKVVNGGIRIVVLQRGWVAVGRFSQDGDECVLQPAAIVRIWGTMKGLTELVNGPVKDKTVLDKSDGPLRYH